jgi:hypothetical protein
MKITIDERISETVEYYLESETFEDFLERLNLTPVEVTLILYEVGKIGDDALDELCPS